MARVRVADEGSNRPSRTRASDRSDEAWSRRLHDRPRRDRASGRLRRLSGVQGISPAAASRRRARPGRRPRKGAMAERASMAPHLITPRAIIPTYCSGEGMDQNQILLRAGHSAVVLLEVLALVWIGKKATERLTRTDF